MRIVFVILHYENLFDTENCLRSIICNYKNDDIQIVIVDNGSKHEKVNTLEEKFLNNSNIYYIYSEDNLGFAKGNNLGFRYAKYELKADIIIVCNNDLVFEQIEFVQKLQVHYINDKFDVAGPGIISLVDGKNQNPVPVQYSSMYSLNIRIIKYIILLLLNYVNLDMFFKKRFSKEIMEFKPQENEDYQLFGACLIFAGKYIQLFDGLFEGTFMYNEESILKERIKEYNLSMKYYNDIVVKHKEGASTQSIYGKGKEKRRFYYYWNLKSCLILKKIKRKRVKL